MSSERAGDLNRDWPGRAAALRSYGGELDQDMVDQLDRAHTPSERTGVHTIGPDELAERYRAATGWEMAEGHAVMDAFLAGYQAVHTSGALNREAAGAMVAAEFPGSMPSDRLLDALEACVVPDPRSMVLTPQEAARLAHAARMAARWEHNNAAPEERMGGEVEFYEREAQYKALAVRLEAISE